MGKEKSLIIGAAIGAALGIIYDYFLGPAPGTSHDSNYRSRLDRALDEGKLAARQKEAELRNQLAEEQQPRSKNPRYSQDADNPITDGTQP